jgi:AAHS family 3-hydroxyphenylpropionic acid transporter
MSNAIPGAGPANRALLWLCALAALLEGFDNQSVGVAMPALRPEFGLGPREASWVLSAAPVGLFLGAAVGGRVADRFGRRGTLAASMLLLGVCSLLTAAAPGLPALVLARFLTGVGLGGALPNFIALASEGTAPAKRVSSVAFLMAGMPLGGVLAGLVAFGEKLGYGWRAIFQVGGVAPIVLSLVIWLLMKPAPATGRSALEGASLRGQARAAGTGAGDASLEGVGSVLFGSGRARTTLLLWGGFFFTQLVLQLMLNWLPSLFVGLGFSRPEASVASMCFNFFGAACSVLLGRLYAGPRRMQWAAANYVGMALALGAIPMTGHALPLAYGAVALAGVVIVGAQMVLFALAPLYYPRPVRGTGVGWAVAIGRLGSVFGPLYAGTLLTAGASSGLVLVGIVPFVALGGVATVLLAGRPRGAGDQGL